MRQRSSVSVGVGLAIIVLAVVGTSLALAPSAGSYPHRTQAPTTRAAPAPAAGVCRSSQQCSPVLPRGTVGATPLAVVLGMVTVAVAVIPPRRRFRRGPRAGHLARGFATTVLPPPRIEGGTT